MSDNADFENVVKEQDLVRALSPVKRAAYRSYKAAQIVKDLGLPYAEAWWLSDAAATLFVLQKAVRAGDTKLSAVLRQAMRAAMLQPTVRVE